MKKMRKQWNKTGLVGKFTIIGIVFTILFGAIQAYTSLYQKQPVVIYNSYHIEVKFGTASESAKFLNSPLN